MGNKQHREGVIKWCVLPSGGGGVGRVDTAVDWLEGSIVHRGRGTIPPLLSLTLAHLVILSGNWKTTVKSGFHELGDFLLVYFIF